MPNDKVLDLSKLKAFADEKINVAQKSKYVLGRVENIVGKGENAGNQHFLLFPCVLKRFFIQGSLKSGLCGKELTITKQLNFKYPQEKKSLEKQALTMESVTTKIAN